MRNILRRWHRCPANTTMIGIHYRCDKWRGHDGIHYSNMGHLVQMVQWPDGWHE